ALNKIDAMTPADANRKRAALSRAIGKEVRLVSGVSGQGVRELVNDIAAMLRARRAEEAEESAEPEERGEWTP
ncbi:MAG TPA: GTPase ObgE, partial [Terricaulis sp.]|nr:GTPase ObgE [Terricaulis sp.]